MTRALPMLIVLLVGGLLASPALSAPPAPEQPRAEHTDRGSPIVGYLQLHDRKVVLSRDSFDASDGNLEPAVYQAMPVMADLDSDRTGGHAGSRSSSRR